MPVKTYVAQLKGWSPELCVDEDSMELSLVSDGSLTLRLLKILIDLDSMSRESTVQLSSVDLEVIRDFITNIIEPPGS